MNTSAIRVSTLVFVIIVMCGLVPGCSEPTQPQPNPEDIVNPDKPNSNGRIVSQAVIGDASKWSYLWELTADHASGYYFRGGYNSSYCVGRLNASGNVSWFFRTSYSPVDVCAGPAGGVVSNALVVAGKQDVDNDGESEIGFVSLISSGGSLMDQLVYSADTSDVWLNSIVPVADSTFLVVGGVRALAMEQPFVATVVLISTGQLEKKHQAVIDVLPGRFFVDLAVDPSVPTSPNWSFYVTSGKVKANDAVHKITVALPDLDPWTINWSVEISVPSVEVSNVNDMCFFDGNLYVAGEFPDPAKTPPPSSGGYWPSAMLGSVTAAGTQRWITAVRLTQHTDAFNSVLASQDGVYGVGNCADFWQQDQAFGYGWISKRSSSSGDLISNWTLGDEKYQSGLDWGILDGSVIHCGGWTHREVSGNYNGWFCNVDISAAFGESPEILPAPIDDADRAVPEDRRSGPDSD
jgi:hypothetical protein